MKQTRYGVFETNSSSTHSLSLNDFQCWKNGSCLFDAEYRHFTYCLSDENYSDENYYTFEDYFFKYGAIMFANYIDSEITEEIDEEDDEEINNWFNQKED